MVKERVLKCVDWRDSGDISSNLVLLIAARENQIHNRIGELKLERPVNGYILVSSKQTAESKLCAPTLLLDDNNEELPHWFQTFLLDCYSDAHNAAADYIEKRFFTNR